MTTLEVIPAEKSDGVFSSEDLAILSQNRRLRQSLIRSLTDGIKIPEDKADKAMLIQLMNGTDAEIISRARVKVAAKSEEALTDVRNLVAQALLQHNNRTIKPLALQDLEPPSSIKARELVPGETEIGTINLTMSDIEEN